MGERFGSRLYIVLRLIDGDIDGWYVERGGKCWDCFLESEALASRREVARPTSSCNDSM